MTLETWILFCLTETVLCLTPGPAVLFVLSLAISRGSRDGLLGAAGIVAANTMYFLISATTVGALLLASYESFFLIKWIGAAYLVWLGVRIFARAGDVARAVDEATVPAPPKRRRLVAFTHGFVTQSANPKAIVFFSAILPPFLDPSSSIALQVAILGISSQVIEIVVLALYVAAAGRLRAGARHARYAASLQRVGAALLIGAGARLAMAR